MIGLGCMRLSTVSHRDSLDPERVIHAALDAGVRLLDTADAYCLGESDVGHNERLIAGALRTWTGDRSTIEVATKGGLRRPGGRWEPDGRAKHLVAASEASLVALDVDAIDLYQLHVVDPRTAIETSVRALAKLQAQGMIRRIGLCNVTVGQLEIARTVAEISSVQVSISVLDDEALRGGVAEYCRDEAIRLLAYRPLGGERATRLLRDPVLSEIAAEHGVTPFELALAWLSDLHPGVVPLPGATREVTARSIGRVAGIALTEADRERLDRRFPAGRLLRVLRSVRRPPPNAAGDVVLVMGMPAAGKSTVARELEAIGYDRLNRDARGGAISELIPELTAGLALGKRHWVLDNTYPTRQARNEVIECAWAAGAPVRCVWLKTNIADGQINAIERLIEMLGRLPGPEELRDLGRRDPRCFGPDAQFRYERTLEPPVEQEGFAVVEELAFTRLPSQGLDGRAIILEYDGVLCESASSEAAIVAAEDVTIGPVRRDTLARYHRDGWRLFASAWRPQVGRGELSAEVVERCFERTRELLGLPIDLRHCPHVAGPPVCWCRKPLPGLVLEFAARHRLPVEQCIIVGRGAADRTLAHRLGARYLEPEEFFSG
ncbi:MAG: aldo/keto reductase [Gemmatimonadota bacterium]